MSEIVPVSLTFDTAILTGQLAPSTVAMYARDFQAYLAFARSPEAALEALPHFWCETQK